MPPSQFALNLEPRVTWDESDFLITGCNEQAAALVRTWPEWPSHVAIIFGPTGSGKSHLARIWQARSVATIGDAAALPTVGSGGEAAPILIEDADRGGIDERAFFHLLNLAKEHRSYVLLTGRTPPGQWPLSLPDLRSRIRSYPSVAIKEPDDELLAAVLIKHFTDRQICIAPDVIPYILSRMERSMGAAQALAAEIDLMALSEHRKVTRSLVTRVLKDRGSSEAGEA